MPAFDGGDDFVGIGGPDERLWVGILVDEEAVDSGLEVDQRMEHAAFQATSGEFGKETLDGVEP